MDTIHENRSDHLDPSLDGVIYNQAQPALPTVPDIDAFLETADIPKCTGQGLPFSLEWYAGAKDRQKARDAEKKVLIGRKNELRCAWTDLILEGLDMWIDKVGNINSEPDPLDVAILLARTVHERPNDTAMINKLEETDKSTEIRRKYWRHELEQVSGRLDHDKDLVVKKQEADDQDERDRIAAEKREKDKKKRNQRLMEQQAAMLAGTTPPPDYDSNEPSSEDEDEEEAKEKAEAAAAAAQEALAAANALKPSLGAVTPGVRGGLARELPPLVDPPVPHLPRSP